MVRCRLFRVRIFNWMRRLSDRKNDLLSFYVEILGGNWKVGFYYLTEEKRRKAIMEGQGF